MRSIKTTTQKRGKLRLATAFTAAALLSLAVASSAQAAKRWQIDSVSNTTAQPGEIIDYRVQVTGVGDEAIVGEATTVRIELPAGFTVTDPTDPAVNPGGEHFKVNSGFPLNFTILDFGIGLWPCTGPDGVTPLAGGESEVICVAEFTSGEPPWQMVHLPVDVDPGLQPGEERLAEASVEGGGAPLAFTADPIRISAAPAGFGIEDHDGALAKEDGSAFTQAGGHPYEAVNSILFNSILKPVPLGGAGWPAEPNRDVVVELPPGLVGNATIAPRCTAAELAFSGGGAISSKPLCPSSSQVGTANLRIQFLPALSGPMPLFNMEPPPGVAARFGFNVQGTLVMLDAVLRSDDEYRLAVQSRNIPEVLAVAGTSVAFWGTPADPSHTHDRACPGEIAPPPVDKGPTCASDGAQVPFLRMPTSCTAAGEPLRFTAHTDSWLAPGGFEANGVPGLGDPAWVSKSFETHHPPTHEPFTPGAPVGVDGCADVPVEGELEAKPTTPQAETSSGLAVRLEVPNPGLTDPDGIASSDLSKVRVSLPQGITINPSQAEGLGACSPAQYESTALSFHPDDSSGCPSDSKIGSVEVETPLLHEKIPGDVYVAEQGNNPFDSLLAIYVVLAEPQRGILVKLAGKVETDGTSGRIVTTFDDLPQLPFSSFDFKFREGARAPLVTPPACGEYITTTEIWGHSDPDGPPIVSESPFTIDRGIGGGPCPPGGTPGFDPGFSAGTLNSNAGSFSPFLMRLTRRDGEQNLTRFNSILPPGVSAKIAGVEKCPEAGIAAAKGRTGRAELASPSCPVGSEIGRSLAGAGVGSVLTYVPGKIYLAGPWNGAPLSVVAITPAVAGPFDVGVVVVRQALSLDPVTAEVDVDGEKSDPIPHILEGIPLKLRDLRVYVDRDRFTLNPTSCDPMSVRATLFGSALDVFNSADDAPVARSSRYQAANCASLGFKPNLKLNLKGGTKRGGHPRLRAVFKPRAGDANLARTVVRLPRSAFLDQAHIRTICTRVQWAQDSCPKGAIYGHVTAFTPLLDEPLKGPAYLRSSDNKLPDLVFDLHGVVEIETAARIDSIRGGIRATFPFVPDAPLSKVVVRMQGGKKGLIQNSRDLCASRNRAAVRLVGHNGRLSNTRPLVRPKCGKRR